MDDSGAERVVDALRRELELEDVAHLGLMTPLLRAPHVARGEVDAQEPLPRDAALHHRVEPESGPTPDIADPAVGADRRDELIEQRIKAARRSPYKNSPNDSPS